MPLRQEQNSNPPPLGPGTSAHGLCSVHWMFSQHLCPKIPQGTSPTSHRPHQDLGSVQFLYDPVFSTQFWNTDQDFLNKEDVKEGLCVWPTFEQCIYWGKMAAQPWSLLAPAPIPVSQSSVSQEILCPNSISWERSSD